MRFLDPRVYRGGSKVIQQGQVFKLKAKGADGEPLWAYRYRLEGRASMQLEGTTGWRFVVEEIERAGHRAHLADPAETAAKRGSKRRAKTDRADCDLLLRLLAAGELPESWIPPAH